MDVIYLLEGPTKKVVVPKVRLVKDSEFTGVMFNSFDDAELRDIDHAGLSREFSRLRNDRDIVAYANKYGLLGIDSAQNTAFLGDDFKYIDNFKYRSQEAMVLESLKEWEWHIHHVNKLFKLFDALQNFKTIEDNHLKIRKMIDYYNVDWADGQPTIVPFTQRGEMSVEDGYREHAWSVLESHLIIFLKRGVEVNFYVPRDDDKSAVGFNFTDRKSTEYLLAAIYYDLWKIVNNIEEVISFCSVCGGAFKGKRKGAMYCSNACKQMKKREPKEECKEGAVEDGEHSAAR